MIPTKQKRKQNEVSVALTKKPQKGLQHMLQKGPQIPQKNPQVPLLSKGKPKLGALQLPFAKRDRSQSVWSSTKLSLNKLKRLKNCVSLLDNNLLFRDLHMYSTWT